MVLVCNHLVYAYAASEQILAETGDVDKIRILRDASETIAADLVRPMHAEAILKRSKKKIAA